MSLSAAVMAHPARRDLVDRLLASLDRPVPVHWDDGGPPAADWDRVWATCAGAWRLIDPGADWGLVLQDDVLVCRDMLAGSERALGMLPADSVASLYLHGYQYIRTTGVDRLADGGWLRRPRLVSGQAIAIPGHAVAGMLAACERSRGLLDDNRIAGHFAELGWSAWFAVPSLVDHQPNGSLIGHPPGRVAHRFVGADRSALEIEWRRPNV